MSNTDLPLTEELDFSYLLGLMRPLHNEDEFAWLPELFTLIGHEKLIDLCRYCGGEVIKIPTLEELNHSIDCMQNFYDVYIKNSQDIDDIPATNVELVSRIHEIYENAR